MRAGSPGARVVSSMNEKKIKTKMRGTKNGESGGGREIRVCNCNSRMINLKQFHNFVDTFGRHFAIIFSRIKQHASREFYIFAFTLDRREFVLKNGRQMVLSISTMF